LSTSALSSVLSRSALSAPGHRCCALIPAHSCQAPPSSVAWLAGWSTVFELNWVSVTADPQRFDSPTAGRVTSVMNGHRRGDHSRDGQGCVAPSGRVSGPCGTS
jgi:hypothetical protein